jgi:hypothetical protein
VKKEGYISMWRKPLNNTCYMKRDPAVKPPLCDMDDNPDEVWYFYNSSNTFISILGGLGLTMRCRVYMCMLQFLYAYFGGSPAREADKIGKKIKNLMFLDFAHRFPKEHMGFCSSIPRGT